MLTFRKHRAVAVLLLLFLLPALFSCTSRDSDFLAWNKSPLRFVGVYAVDGVSYRASFALDGRDVMTVTLLSPTEALGVVYEKSGDTVNARYGDVTLPLSATPAAIEAALLCYPENPVLDTVLSEGAVRTETVRADGGIYKIRYGADGLPEEILLENGDAPTSLFIESFDAP